LFHRGGESGFNIHDSELRAIGCDNAERADANLPVHAHTFCGVLNTLVPLN
jgi:hypothetical protein